MPYLRKSNRSKGFTIVELLVVVFIILILSSLLLPSLRGAYGKASGAACVNNLKNLQLCWQMYVDDFRGRVPYNSSYQVNRVWRSTPFSWIGDSSALHDTTFDTIKNGLLFRYDYNRSIQSYKCPADDSRVEGSDTERIRSYSMNGVVGGNYEPDQPHGEVPIVTKESDIRDPSNLFVFIDEHEDSIDDAHFLVYPNPETRWVNMPAARHHGNGVLSFADGHVDLIKWRAAKNFSNRTRYWKDVTNRRDVADLRLLQSYAHAHWDNPSRE